MGDRVNLELRVGFMTSFAKEEYILSARRTIEMEQEAVIRLGVQLDDCFADACQILMQCKGRIIVTGIGKSGHISRKIAATLASTGSPAFFVHAGEASHGDMGMITPGDIVIALSNSGRTEEIIRLLPRLKRAGVPVIGITGDKKSLLATQADIHLYIGVQKEACPLNLAPTSSTTVALVMGDALAIALLEAKGFTREDFAFSHPGGALGASILLTVDEIMHTGAALPVVKSGEMLSQSLLEMSSKGLGMTAICLESGIMTGIFTDGDLRRAIDKGVDPRITPIDDVMTEKFTTVPPGMLAAEALKKMQDNSINGLYCVDNEGYPVGAFNMLDLVKAGIL